MKIVSLLTVVALFLAAGAVYSQEADTIALPTASLASDKPFMQTVKDRKSSREYSDRELSLQDLANVLWCANGVNRPETGKRTSPSAMNKQDVDVYAVLKDGIYLYDATGHRLLPIVAGDYRKDAGTQAYVGTAPLNLIYVSDLARFDYTDDREQQAMMAAIDAGHCSENVYLYGAAANLAVVIRASIDKAKMAELLKLRDDQLIIIAQTVGHPK
ncbi:MAG TPA: SagB/ThcOx family dehydrogenase [Acidobacteriota bacterium]|nr:SagB/ThcOx family dehydrogenase [Acidobacteriota bacterium]